MGYKFKCVGHMAYETHYQWYYTHCLQALPGINRLFKNLLYACKHIVVISFGSLLITDPAYGRLAQPILRPLQQSSLLALLRSSDGLDIHLMERCLLLHRYK